MAVIFEYQLTVVIFLISSYFAQIISIVLVSRGELVMKPGKLQKAGLLFRFWGWTGPSRDPDPAHHIKNHIKTCNGFLFFH